ncbi:unnamed protein product [Lymnaea stagnalis]|uniref:Uncharacterized protein n=1 Tax=Lymnaea stagnalis TaxID=6523 RepID=A0AAV2IQA2_LYMST
MKAEDSTSSFDVPDANFAPDAELLPDANIVPDVTIALQETQIEVVDTVSTSSNQEFQISELLSLLRDELLELKEKFRKIESTLGVERVTLKDVGDKVMVIVESIAGTTMIPVPPLTGMTSVEPGTINMKSPSAAVVALQQTMATKGAPPGGMTAEQLQDFKKMTLQINALQQKIKDLENKLTDASSNIKKGTERADEMEEKENESIKDIYKCMDQINNSLSEKIAQQKVEVQKIAGDTPKPINYDPFNYGEAYGGDVVDFQARRRILEIKLLLQGLQSSMAQLRDSVKVSPSIDLGYKIVRLDQLIASSGFGKAIQKGDATHEDVLVVSNSKVRIPGKVDYPKKEIFQVTDDMESNWAITDSIMQTMYRLEMELGDLQKVVGSSDLSTNTKLLEELQASIKHVKEKAVDVKTVKRLIEDTQANKPHAPLPFEKKSQITECGASQTNLSNISKAKFDNHIKTLTTSVHSLMERLGKIEMYLEKRPGSASSKRNAKNQLMEIACLSCDREVELPNQTEPPVPHSSYFNPTISPRIPKAVFSPPRLRYLLHRNYKIDTEGLDVYTIPRPMGGGYTQYWPKSTHLGHHKQFETIVPQAPLTRTENTFIQGCDGRLYKADTNLMQAKMKCVRQASELEENHHEKKRQFNAGLDVVIASVNYKGKSFNMTTETAKSGQMRGAVATKPFVQGIGKNISITVMAENPQKEVFIHNIPIDEVSEEVPVITIGEATPLIQSPPPDDNKLGNN